MNFRHGIQSFVVLFLGLLKLSRGSQQQQFTVKNITIFGDSMSDVGNIFARSGGAQPPPGIYYNGRYSNGPIWSDFLASFLNVDISTLNDFAYGGATTNNDYIPGVSTFLNATVPSIADQVHSYVNEVVDSPGWDNSTLHLIWAGYNDYWFYVNDNLTASSNLYDVADRVTTNLLDSVDTLLNAGATWIMVGDLPNMQEFPDAESKTREQYRAYGLLTEYHNRLLWEKISDVSRDYNPTVQMFSPHNLFQDFVTHPHQFGYVKTSQACLVNGTVCEDPLSKMFWDYYHPTMQTHYRLARMILTLLELQ
jgi:thermolabile hemolysin